MDKKVSRRDFIKIVGVSAASVAVLTGCGPASRYVVREPYTKMPEYTYNGKSTFYATTCRECPAGCGIVVRTMQGRALKVEGNPNHPVNQGKTCSRGQASLQGLYNPDRIQYPFQQNRDGGEQTEMTWDQAISVVKEALQSSKPDEVGFLLGTKADHLTDLIFEISSATGMHAPWRYGAQEIFDVKNSLAQAAENVFGIASIPSFDLGNADLIFSFGANFLETYLSPVAYARGFSRMRKGGQSGKRGYLIQFEPRLSQTGTAADEWIPVIPGMEGFIALGIGLAVSQIRGGDVPAAYQGLDLEQIASKTGINQGTFNRLAGMFIKASNPLAIPGGTTLSSSNGVEAGQAILSLNALANNLGQPGGVYLTPPLPVHTDNPTLPSPIKDLEELVSFMKSGALKVLFVHGVNPIFEIPETLGFAEALANVPKIISFSSFPDETAQKADYVFPDHTGLESWGYQKIQTGGDRPVISGSQPVVVPFYNTKSTADVLLAAVQSIGGKLAETVPYKDEVAFLQNSVKDLIGQPGFFTAQEIHSFWAEWQQNGGWWNGEAGLGAPSAPGILEQAIQIPDPQYVGDGDFHLFVFPSPILSDGSGANKPWLQETPDPTTTVMWNTWIEIHPDTADQLGIKDDDVVRVSSPFGEVEASVYRYPAIRPDTIGIPFGQGHSAYGRYAQNRGVNPGNLFGKEVNQAGSLVTTNLKVKIEKTGRKRSLARMESRLGVYGNIQ